MGTGIVSIALALDHRNTLSAILLVIAAASWIALALALVLRVRSDPGRVRAEARSPAALTGVAASAVVGARVVGLGWDWLGDLLLATAAGGWLLLIGVVLRSWRTPSLGVGFMVTVSTESLSVLAAALAVRHGKWLLYGAVATFVLGLVLYGFVLHRFDFHQLVGGRGDQWITGGALAIATLAVTRIVLAAHSVHALRRAVPALKVLSLALWSASAIWLVALLIAEVVHLRPRYDLRRWATVFPVGMYAASSFDTGAVARVPFITEFARLWVWVALVFWTVVFAGLVAHGQRLVRTQARVGDQPDGTKFPGPG